MGQLYQYTRAIAGFGVTAASAAVLHIFEHGKRIINNLVIFMTVNIGYKSSSARVVFKLWPVKALVAFSIIHFNKNRL